MLASQAACLVLDELYKTHKCMRTGYYLNVATLLASNNWHVHVPIRVSGHDELQWHHNLGGLNQS